MKKQKDEKTEADLLRRKAEELLMKRKSEISSELTENEILRLNHELTVHQIELELQNGELVDSKRDLEIAVEKYTDLYEFAPTGYITLSQEGQVAGLNLTASKILAQERRYLINNLFGAFVAKDSKKTYYNFLREVFDSCLEKTCELIINKKDGHPTYIYLIGQVSRKSKYCDISIIDITDRRLAEDKLTESKKELERLIQMNADKDLFISILAHDLRNPLSLILGYSELLSEDITQPEGSNIHNLANEINKSAHATFYLLEDILKWSTVRTGKIPFEPRILNLKDICISVIDSLFALAAAKNIEIRCMPGEELKVSADEDMLKAVLRNLVSNAIKFTETNGEIRISAERKNTGILISVSDNGIGIEPERLKKLFNISHFHSKAGTSNEKGTGLGLLLCKDFVEKHGGKIWAESEYGKGSAFYFEIPGQSRPEREAASADVSGEEHIYDLKVLIADDNAALRMILGAMIKNYSREILFADGGVSAVSTCAKNPDIDLILIDMYMPDMNGFEAVKQIRAINKNVKIIAETARTLSELTEENTGNEINDYFFKPYSRTFLDQLIRKHFKKQGRHTDTF